MNLYPFQRNAVDHVLHSKHRSVLVVGPTGTGKTYVLADLVQKFVGQGKRVLVLAHRDELVKQSVARILARLADKVRKGGTRVGVIAAKMKHRADPEAPVQIAMVQTLIRRECPDADVVIVDEAHHTPAKSYRKTLKAYPGARVIGFTATPIFNGKAASMGDLFDDMFEMIQPQDAQDLGVLAPVEGTVWLRKIPGLENVKLRGGDFDVKQLGKVMSQRTIVGSIVANWKREAEGRSTLVFCASRRQGQKTTRAFRKAGVRVEYLDGETASSHRAAVLARFNNGDFPVLVNVDLFTEGVDIERVKCVVIARPTYSTIKFLQMIGRGRRPYGGTACLIHDHAGVFGTHGHPNDSRDWKLGGKTKGTPMVTCPNGHVRHADVSKCPKGCTFEGHDGVQDPVVELRGYRYDIEEFSKIRAAQMAEAKRLYEADPTTTLDAVALTCGLVASTVRAAARRGGWSRGQKPFDTRAADLALAEYRRGTSSLKSCADKYGLVHCSLHGYAKRAGINIRANRISLSRTQEQEALKMRRSGSTISEISTAVGASRHVVLARMRDLLGTLPPARKTHAPVAAVKEARVFFTQTGDDYTEIAKRVGVSEAVVRIWERRFGWVRSPVACEALREKHPIAYAKYVRRTGQ